MDRLTVREFLEALPHRVDLAVVRRGSPLKEVVKAMVKDHRRRIVYVINPEGKLQGAIFLDDLKDVIFRYYLEARVGKAQVVTEHLLELFAAEKAEDLMVTGLPVCRDQEDLTEVITRMLEGNLKDLPIVDQDDRLVGDLDILCLLELWLQRGEALFP